MFGTDLDHVATYLLARLLEIVGCFRCGAFAREELSPSNFEGALGLAISSGLLFHAFPLLMTYVRSCFAYELQIRQGNPLDSSF